MIDQFYKNLSSVLAHSVMYEQGVQWPEEHCAGVVNVDYQTGSSSGQTSTVFQRRGSTTSGKRYVLPSDLASLIQGSTGTSAVPGTLNNESHTFLEDLITRNPGLYNGVNVLETIMAMTPENYQGVGALEKIAERNPYSTDYEDATKGLYDRQFEIARSDAMSGPGNVRGGQARTSFALADTNTQQALNRFDKVRDTQQREAGIVEQAVQVANQIEAMRRGTVIQAQQAGQQSENARTVQSIEASNDVTRKHQTNLASLQLAADTLGQQQGQTKEDLAGRGQQFQQGGSNQWNGGITCCFIFLEVLNGKLPQSVRWGRDEFATPNRINGYRWMAQWLVPQMKKHYWLIWLVNTFMVKPFIACGTIYYAQYQTLTNFARFLILAPYCFIWFYTWALLGKLKGECKTYGL